MKLLCKGSYHNQPADLHFGAGVIEVDDWKAEFLLRDAPENFERYVEPPAATVVAPDESETKALDEPVKDKQVKTPARKK